MKSFISYLAQSSRNIISSLLVLLMAGVLVVSAAAPTGGYNIAQTLDPDCTPGSTDCFVKSILPTGGTAGQVLSTTGGGVYTWSTPSTVATSVPATGVTGAADVTAGSTKVTLGGTPVGAVLKAFTVDVNEANLSLQNIGGALSTTQQSALSLGNIGGSLNLATQVTGTLPIANGGTGLSSVGTAGQVLTSNGTSLVYTTPTTGTVTSVDASGGTTGLTFTGGPITSSGTLTLGGSLAVANGGTGATTASGALTNLLPTGSTNGQVLTSDGAGNFTFSTPTNPTSVAWSLTGNSGTTPGTNFIGTTDAQDVVVKTNSNERIRVTQAGRILTSNAIPSNVLLGNNIGNETMTGSNNQAIGTDSLINNTTGVWNTAIGTGVLPENTTGSLNVGIGSASLLVNTTGNNNTAIGVDALRANTTGGQNVGLGYRAGRFMTTGSNNIAIGLDAQVPSPTASGQMNIGNIIYATGRGTIGMGNVGIGTGINPINNKLEITHGTAGNSGLRFTNLTSATVPGTTSSKFLTVDTNGDVVLLNASSPKWYAENTAAPSSAPTATGSGSIAIGNAATATGNNSIAMGESAAAPSAHMFVYGSSSGGAATNAANSIFIGNTAGTSATNANNSNFIGAYAGQGAVNANYSNFFGREAGFNASTASHSNFIGYVAGFGATNATSSVFIGRNAGESATNASHSNFIGNGAGNLASNASYSNLFGFNAGKFFTGNNIGSNNIIIGTNVSLPDATANSMNIGGVLFGTGFYSTTTGNPSTTALTTGRIGIGNVTPGYLFHVGSSSFASGTDVARFENAGGTCTVTPNTAGGITCTSDINYKKDITDVSNTDILSKITQLDIKSYRMIADGSDTEKQIGFIAQNVETIFPHLVQTDTDGRKAVSYAGMTPLLTAAIKELNLKLDTGTTKVSDTEFALWTDAGHITTYLDAINNESPRDVKSFFSAKMSTGYRAIGDFVAERVTAFNGYFENVFAKRVRTSQLCVDDVCVSRDQFMQMVNGSGSSSTIITTVTSGTSTAATTDTAGGSAGTGTSDTIGSGTTTPDTSVTTDSNTPATDSTPTTGDTTQGVSTDTGATE